VITPDNPPCQSLASAAPATPLPGGVGLLARQAQPAAVSIRRGVIASAWSRPPALPPDAGLRPAAFDDGLTLDSERLLRPLTRPERRVSSGGTHLDIHTAGKKPQNRRGQARYRFSPIAAGAVTIRIDPDINTHLRRPGSPSQDPRPFKSPWPAPLEHRTSNTAPAGDARRPAIAINNSARGKPAKDRPSWGISPSIAFASLEALYSHRSILCGRRILRSIARGPAGILGGMPACS